MAGRNAVTCPAAGPYGGPDLLVMPAPMPALPDQPLSPALRVVVADDSPDVRRHLVEMLREIAAVEVVAEAGDTPSALASAEQFRPEVVVLDLQMPGESGLVALQHLQALLPETQVIILTNHANPFYRRKCMEEGASFFFDKSIEFDKVAETVRSLAARSRA
jgi:DNA-binding NarL/FixJ family response regulator